MFDVKKTAADRVELTIAGKIDAPEMSSGVDALLATSEGMRGANMLYKIDDFHMPSWAAIGAELYRIPKLFALLPRFDKIAVICDQAGVRTGAEIEGTIIPGLAIKGFASTEADAAEAWLAASA